jgi:hypothetical protein
MRIPLRLPIIVSDEADKGAWSESTETDDISTLGALFGLDREVSPGDRLHIHTNCRDGAPVEVTAKVIRIAPSATGPTRIGVQIADPTEDWLRLYASWAGDR